MKKYVLLPFLCLTTLSTICQVKLTKMMINEHYESNQDFDLEVDNSVLTNIRLNTSGDLTIKAPNLTLSQVYIKAKRIFLKKEAIKFLIEGSVTLEADYIEIETNSSPVEISGKSANAVMLFTTPNLLNPSAGSPRGFNVVPLRNIPVKIQFN